MGWLEDAIAKYTEKNSDGTPKYDWGSYVDKYGQNSVNGTMDTDGNGSLDIDCSHLVSNILQEAGCNIKYRKTSDMANSGFYDKATDGIKAGDIILFNGHVGIVISYDPKTKTGKFFGSQTKTGPAITDFGLNTNWNGSFTILRPKSNLTPQPSLPTKPRTSSTITRRDPLMLDLDGDGVISTLGTDAGIHFDHDGNGFKELSGWVAPGDGMLMLDRDADGSLDNGSELFGDFTPLANGMLAVNGFQALAQFDTNGDGKIDASDPIWSQLKVWQHDPEATDLGDPDSSGILRMEVMQ